MKIEQIIKEALAEDIGKGDLTSNAIIPAKMSAKAKIIAKQNGVICGMLIAEAIFRSLNVKLIPKVKDGRNVSKGTVIAVLSGPARKILAGERTALNFLQRLSGISTTTSEFVKQCAGTKAIILDTRKTMPMFREIEKYAVKCGGGTNHRMGLNDAILIKDNHTAVLNSIISAIQKAKKAGSVEVEVKNTAELVKALSAGADRVLLDNMNIGHLKKSVEIVKKHNLLGKKKVRTEASGGVNIGNVRQIAKTGVDYISIGALTHSPKALDISLEIE